MGVYLCTEQRSSLFSPLCVCEGAGGWVGVREGFNLVNQRVR